MKYEGWSVLRITVCYIYPGQISHSEFSIYLYETNGRFGQLGKNMAQPVKSLWPELHGLAKWKKKIKPNQ